MFTGFPPALEQFAIAWVLVLTRLSLLLGMAPALGAGVPQRVRALFAMALALVVTPLVTVADLSTLDTIPELGISLAREALIGLMMGLVIQLLITGMQTIGELASSSGGLQMGDSFDPQSRENVPVLSHMIGLLSIAVLLLTGGHRQMLDAFLGSFSALPLGRWTLGSNVLPLLLGEVTSGFAAGIRGAAPMLAAVMLANLITGLISRTLPQLNLMAIGWNINTIAVLVVIVTSVTGIATVFDAEASESLARLRDWLIAQADVDG